MKKILCIILALVMLLSFAACSDKKDTEGAQANSSPAQSADGNGNTPSSSQAALPKSEPDITFKEQTYVTLINDVYNNPDNYLGKTIQIDGMYTLEDFTTQSGKKYYYVYRQGPGCCGNDGSMCGFEFTTADGKYPSYVPKSGDANNAHPWIKVTGVLEQYYEGEGDQKTGPYFTLSNARYEVMNERGSEIVKL